MAILRPLVRLAITAAVIASLTTPPAALAAFPDKPLRIVVPLAPGGGTDLLARMLGPKLADRLGQSVVIDNKPGANQIIAADVERWGAEARDAGVVIE